MSNSTGSSLPGHELDALGRGGVAKPIPVVSAPPRRREDAGAAQTVELVQPEPRDRELLI